MKIPRRKRKRHEVRLRPVHPNAGLRAAYKQRLEDLVDEMQRSVVYWITAAYRADPPRMALDATPAKELQAAVRAMAKRWQTRFDEAAPELAWWFAQSTRTRSEAALKAILRKGGFSVKFRLTPAARDILDATVNANVALIKSIPSEYLTQVEGMVMRSVQTGRDLGTLTKDLQEQYGVTRRRAALIARDQNAKATSAIQKARQLEIGLKEGIWMHSHGGKKPRSTHVANDGKRFNIETGWFDPDPKVRQRIMPGQLINCRCVWRPIVPGFD